MMESPRISSIVEKCLLEKVRTAGLIPGFLFCSRTHLPPYSGLSLLEQGLNQVTLTGVKCLHASKHYGNISIELNVVHTR